MCSWDGSWSPSVQHKDTRSIAKSLLTNILQLLCGLDWIKNRARIASLNLADLWSTVRAKSMAAWLSSCLGRRIGQDRSTVHAVLLFIKPAMYIVHSTVFKARFSCYTTVRKPQSRNMWWHSGGSARDVPSAWWLCCHLWFLCLCCYLLDWWYLQRAMHLQIQLLVCLVTACCDSQDQCVQSVRTHPLSEAQGVPFLVNLDFAVCVLAIVSLLFSVSQCLLHFLHSMWHLPFCWVLV